MLVEMLGLDLINENGRISYFVAAAECKHPYMKRAPFQGCREYMSKNIDLSVQVLSTKRRQEQVAMNIKKAFDKKLQMTQ